MTIRSRWTFTAVVFLVAVATIAFKFRGDIAVVVLRPVIERNFRLNTLTMLPDGLHIGVCGAASAMPAPNRDSSCLVIIAGEREFVVDAGTGIKNIQFMGLPSAKVEAVFLTHFHSDHIDGLGDLMLLRWAIGSHADPLPVYGPTGVDQVVDGFNTAYGLDGGYRVAHHGSKIVPPTGFGLVAKPYPIPSADGEVVVLDEAPLKVVAFLVDHSPVAPAVGYKITYKDRRVVISGDTRKTASVERESMGVDVLVHDAMSPALMHLLQDAAARTGHTSLAQIFSDILQYHTSSEEAAAIAHAAGVKYLVLYHIMPALPTRALNPAFLGKAPTIFEGPIDVARDGDLVSLPAGSEKVTLSNQLPN